MSTQPEAERLTRWASTMHGFVNNDASAVVCAHDESPVVIDAHATEDRLRREEQERRTLCEGATRSLGAGNRAVEEAPDPLRTCFERDRDRIVHSSAFRRLAGKTQVFVFPEDHQRTRLTHALEVAQVSTAIARALRLNVALTEAVALGHDCGHGPGGHPSEDVFSKYLPGGFDHAPFGAQVMLAPLNLCAETIDGIANHSWSRPAPRTPEGEVVSWADRIAYVCHDFEDARSVGIVCDADLPEIVVQRCGVRHARQIASFVDALVRTASSTGRIGMFAEDAAALAAFRSMNYERIYFRPESIEQADRVRRMLEALVEAFAHDPSLLPPGPAREISSDSNEAFAQAVTYVAGMTDRFAVDAALRVLHWPSHELPRAVHASLSS